MYFKRKRKSFLRNIVERQKLQKNVKSNFKEFKDYSIINRFGISCYMNQDENLVAILNNGKLFDIFPVDDCSKVKIVVRRTYGRSLYLQINSHVYMKDSPTSKLMELEFMSDVNIENGNILCYDFLPESLICYTTVNNENVLCDVDTHQKYFYEDLFFIRNFCAGFLPCFKHYDSVKKYFCYYIVYEKLILNISEYFLVPLDSYTYTELPDILINKKYGDDKWYVYSIVNGQIKRSKKFNLWWDDIYAGVSGFNYIGKRGDSYFLINITSNALKEYSIPGSKVRQVDNNCFDVFDVRNGLVYSYKYDQDLDDIVLLSTSKDYFE